GRLPAERVESPRPGPLLGGSSAGGPAAVTRPSAQAGRERRRDTPLRRARTCYDHLAGVAGVALLHAMRARRWLVERAAGRPGFDLTRAGARALERRGVSLGRARARRRQFAARGLAWAERPAHPGGALRAAILAALSAADYVRRIPGNRAVRINRRLDAWLAG